MDNIQIWLNKTSYKDYAITVASADASFRQYYRLDSRIKSENDGGILENDEVKSVTLSSTGGLAQTSVLLMDSSLEKESLSPFIDVTARLLNAGVKAPKILEKNLDDGFLILEDFGNTHLLNLLDKNNFKKLYSNAIDEIVKMQNADTKNLPPYDKEFLHFEMDLMKDWYLEKNLNIILKREQKEIISSSLNAISNVVLSQPQDVFVHRDYHSRNIMLTPADVIGVIDYQDAMCGPITYDLVSLLKDCYIEFNREDIEELALEFRDKKGLNAANEEFIKWFDFMGLQRHIKVLGIFSRLYLRDSKDGYLKDIPLTLKYTIETASRYDETKELAKLLQELRAS